MSYNPYSRRTRERDSHHRPQSRYAGRNAPQDPYAAYNQSNQGSSSSYYPSTRSSSSSSSYGGYGTAPSYDANRYTPSSYYTPPAPPSSYGPSYNSGSSSYGQGSYHQGSYGQGANGQGTYSQSYGQGTYGQGTYGQSYTPAYGQPYADPYAGSNAPQALNPNLESAEARLALSLKSVRLEILDPLNPIFDKMKNVEQVLDTIRTDLSVFGPKERMMMMNANDMKTNVTKVDTHLKEIHTELESLYTKRNDHVQNLLPNFRETNPDLQETLKHGQLTLRTCLREIQEFMANSNRFTQPNFSSSGYAIPPPPPQSLPTMPNSNGPVLPSYQP